MSLGNASFEMLALGRLLDSKDPELLLKLKSDLFANKELCNIHRIITTTYTNLGTLPSYDYLTGELTDRIPDPSKQKFYLDLISDIKGKDAPEVTTDVIIEKLKNHKKFRTLLDGAGKLVDAVDKRDADLSVGVMQELYEKIFREDAGADLASADMCNMAGQEVKVNRELTGLSGFDNLAGITGLVAVCGEAKSGKSLLAQQMLTYGHEHYDGSSLYIVLEQTAAELRYRILAAKSELNIGHVMSGTLTAEEKLKLRIAEAEHLCDFNANMLDFITQTASEPDNSFWRMYWDHFQPKKNRFYLCGHCNDWDSIFPLMQLYVELKGVRRICIDYPWLLNRGRAHAAMSSWEYNLLMSKNLKSFSRQNEVIIITPAQFDSATDRLKFVSNIANDCDSVFTMKQEDGDSEYGYMGALTVTPRVVRNYLSKSGEGALKPFKLLRRFDVCKFESFDF